MNLVKLSNKIPAAVTAYAAEHAETRTSLFISYLVKRGNEIGERVFAFRKYKDGVKIVEVMRRSTDNVAGISKNLVYSHMGGYTPIYEGRDVYASSRGYPYLIFSSSEYDFWWKNDKAPGISRVYINADMLKETDEFKYCGYSNGDCIDYLLRYRSDPYVEYFGKLDLPLSPRLMKRCKAEKEFRSFVIKHAAEIGVFGVQACEYAYEHGTSIEEARRICYEARYITRWLIPEAKGFPHTVKLRMQDYCCNKGVNCHEYNDYLKAVKKLELDLTDTKVLYPYNFSQMHDLRTAEYDSVIQKENAEKAVSFAKDFKNVADKARKFAEYDSEEYMLLIPQTLDDLKSEGEALSHCVGRMGYDKKMVDGKIVILFLRRKEEPDKPYVTVEYNLKDKRITQAHGKNNSSICALDSEFLNQWIEYAKTVRRRSV